MGVTERREREKTALRREILAAARELFAKEGYESVSMRKIAEKIEYSPTTIYLYFQDKNELIQEICNETFSLLCKRLEKVVAGPGDPVERLKGGLREYIAFGLKHPEHYRVSLMMPCDIEEHKAVPFEKTEGGRAFEFLIRGVTECIEAGLFRETDVLLVSQSLWMVVHGVTSLWISRNDIFPWRDRDRLINLTIDSAVEGMLR